ncbi:MAG: hypothetical protein IIX91_06870 [Clostridia bacterium]|nr:hypothetical protein [Clostridia bacterium]
MAQKKTSIVFTGDIGFDRYMAGKWEDEALLSPRLLAFLQSGDHLCINVEGSLIDAADDGTRGVFFHSMNPKAAPFFGNVHVEELTLRCASQWAEVTICLLSVE